MRIVVAASEMTPLAKTGGLGDVLGALPRAMAREGHDVRVFLPHYPSIDLAGRKVTRIGGHITVDVGGTPHEVNLSVVKDRQRGLEVILVGCDHYFDRPALYVDPETGKDYPDNDERFILFGRAVMESCRAIGLRPDVIHAHDWQAALLPVFLKTHYANDEVFAGAKSVLTIHNLAHQGLFPGERFRLLNLPDALFGAEQPVEFYGQVNFLKAGINFADKITTVSERYAEEIQTGKFGCGLEGVLAGRKDDLVGILNGVDYTVWSPSRDKNIPYRYHINNLAGKRMTKVELLNTAGLPVRDQSPLVGMIARLVQQKGLDLIAEAADRMLALDLQFIVLGTGEEKYHKLLTMLQERHPDKVRVYLRHDEKLAHQIEAGADAFLMPSLFEPCGLNQMYSLKYGTVPIVNHVGGLADTIEPFDPEKKAGTGFVFNEETPEALLASIEEMVRTYSRRRLWTGLMKNGMRQDYSWGRAVAKYIELFHSLTN